LYFDEKRQRWIVSLDTGFSPMGKRRRIEASALTKTEAKALLLKVRRDAAAGLPPEQRGYTVGEAVEAWLAYGMTQGGTLTKGARAMGAIFDGPEDGSGPQLGSHSQIDRVSE
jgi:hypothetical protein